MKVCLDDGAYIPTREHFNDAGMDLRSREMQTIEPHGSAVFSTGVHIELPKYTFAAVRSRSGLNFKHGIVVGEGTIDEGYRGNIGIKLYNLSDEPYTVKIGDKIAQLVIIPCVYEKCKLVESVSDSERGANGFGSSGR